MTQMSGSDTTYVKPPWDFLEKPRHVAFLEVINKDTFRNRLLPPRPKGFTATEAAELWAYCMRRELVTEKEVAVPGSEMPFEPATRHEITKAGLRLLWAYEKRKR